MPRADSFFVPYGRDKERSSHGKDRDDADDDEKRFLIHRVSNVFLKFTIHPLKYLVDSKKKNPYIAGVPKITRRKELFGIGIGDVVYWLGA
ncbi:hypothetical protein HYV73_01980 [Candidatus Uhrbacteria bacterium]|nr:hypothetical protein [Candidatus Uhrbacteria bacterium]